MPAAIDLHLAEDMRVTPNQLVPHDTGYVPGIEATFFRSDARDQRLGVYLDKRVAQARAEERRAMAVAQEQEMKALVGEMKAEVVKAEAQVPLALADAFRSGNLGVMDYMKYRNVQADTAMRKAIAGPDDAPIEDLE